MRIGLMGLSDKRHIMYTLIRVLGGLGRTIIFTPNAQYLMLSEEQIFDFEINDIHVVIYSCDIDDLEEEYDLNSYEYVIYDILKELPFNLDIGLILDCREIYIYELEDRELEQIPIFTACKVEKNDYLHQEKNIKMPPASFVEPVLQEMFTTRKILPVSNGAFVKGMTPFITSILDISEAQVKERLKKGRMNV